MKVEPGKYGFPIQFKSRYANFIGGKWVAPVKGEYFENTTPITGKVLCEIPRSTADDVELALDAAHAAKAAWGRTSATERANILNKIADRMEANLALIAHSETWDNGKPIRETMAADIPLAIDHFRYFAACVRAQEGSIGEVDHNTVAYHFHEPLGVVGPDHSVEFPDPDGGVEARAGSRRRQLRRAQAGGADTGVNSGIARADPGSAAGGRAERGQRLRGRSGQAARVQQPHCKDCLHRRNDDRPADHAVRVPEPDPGHAGARRQVAQHLLRRCSGQRRRFLRQGARRVHDVRAEPGRSLHLPVAGAGAGVDLRALHRAGGRAREEGQAGQPARRFDHDRRAGIERAAAEDSVLCRHRQAGGREAPYRRRKGGSRG